MTIFTVEVIIFYILLIDALAVNFVIWFGSRWYSKGLQSFSRWFPPAKGWAMYYLLLMLLMGFLMFQFGLILPNV